MPSQDQNITELEVTVKCSCTNTFTFKVWDENWFDNPYVDVICACNRYYKKLSDLQKNGAEIIDKRETGRTL